jgi:hypothetical protein
LLLTLLLQNKNFIFKHFKNDKMSYFKRQIDQSNQNFMGADGWESANAWNSASGRHQSFDGQELLNATGNTTNESQPYIITVVNTTTVAVSNVEILYAIPRQSAPTTAGVTYTYNSGGLTYQSFLQSIAAGETFGVGALKLIYSNASSSSTAIANVSSPITITTYSLAGNQAVRPLTPVLDDYQQVQNQVTIRQQFMVTGLVSMILGTLYGSTTVQIFIYPLTKVNRFSEIQGGGSDVTQFSDPGINPFKKAISGR